MKADQQFAHLLLALTLCLGVGTTVVGQNPVIFNGGISLEERANAPITGTKLVFFVRAGNFLSGVSVVVRNAAGVEVVNTVTTGPWLILDLPNGRYRVSASIASGESQGVEFDVDGAAQEFGLMFTSLN